MVARQQGSLPTCCLNFFSLLKAVHHLWGSHRACRGCGLHPASLTQQPLPASLCWVPCQEQMGEEETSRKLTVWPGAG